MQSHVIFVRVSLESVKQHDKYASAEIGRRTERTYVIESVAWQRGSLATHKQTAVGRYDRRVERGERGASDARPTQIIIVGVSTGLRL